MSRSAVPRIGATRFEPGNEGALYPIQCWTSTDQKTTGMVRAKLHQNLWEHGDGVSGVTLVIGVACPS